MEAPVSGNPTRGSTPVTAPAPDAQPSFRDWIPGLSAPATPETAAQNQEAPPQATAAEPVPEQELVLDEVDEQVLDARRQLKDKQLVLDAARGEVEEVDNAIAVFERDLQSAQRLLASARQEVQATTEAVRTVTAEMERLTATGAAEPELEALRGKLEEAQTRLRQAREEAAVQMTRVRESSACWDNWHWQERKRLAKRLRRRMR